eukprot:g78570.t1
MLAWVTLRVDNTSVKSCWRCFAPVSGGMRGKTSRRMVRVDTLKDDGTTTVPIDMLSIRYSRFLLVKTPLFLFFQYFFHDTLQIHPGFFAKISLHPVEAKLGVPTSFVNKRRRRDLD